MPASLFGHAVITWGPGFLARVHGMSRADIGVGPGWTVGLGLGPLLVGILNDHVFGEAYGSSASRYSMLVVGVLGGLASVLFWRASRTLEEELVSRDMRSTRLARRRPGGEPGHEPALFRPG